MTAYDTRVLKIRGPANLAGAWSAQPVPASRRPPHAAHRPAGREPREGGVSAPLVLPVHPWFPPSPLRVGGGAVGQPKSVTSRDESRDSSKVVQVFPVDYACAYISVRFNMKHHTFMPFHVHTMRTVRALLPWTLRSLGWVTRRPPTLTVARRWQQPQPAPRVARLGIVRPRPRQAERLPASARPRASLCRRFRPG